MRPDLEGVLDQCLEAAAAPERWPETLRLLANAMGCRGALMSRPTRNHVGILYSPGMEDVSELFFGEGWNLRDLRSAKAMVRGVTRITADQHVISPDDLRTSDYYNGFARRVDVPWFAAFGAVAPGNSFVGLSFQRRQAEGAFSSIELATISRAVPRLRQAMTLSSAVMGNQASGRLEGLALVDQAAVLLGDNGELLACNAMAEVLLLAGTGLRRGPRGLVAAHPPSRQRVEQYLAAACGTGPDASLVASMPLAVACTDGLTLVLQASPVVGDAAAVFGAGRCVLMITQVGASRTPSAECLRVAFDLTTTEARVAVALASGKPVKQVADDLGMSHAAVRFHIKSILPKAQVRTTAQFVAAAGRLA